MDAGTFSLLFGAILVLGFVYVLRRKPKVVRAKSTRPKSGRPARRYGRKGRSK